MILRKKQESVIPKKTDFSKYYPLLFILISCLCAFVVDQIQYTTYDRCVGQAFLDPKKSQGTGEGRCDRRSVVGLRFLPIKLAVWYLSFQGEFVNGELEGNAQYNKWRMFFNYDLYGYEGSEKVLYVGKFSNSSRNGFGKFEVADGSSWTGDWLNNSLSSSSGVIRYGTKNLKSTNPRVAKGISVKAGIVKSLLHGRGKMTESTAGKDMLELEGEWNNGFINKIFNVTVAKKELFTIKAIDDRMEGSTRICKFEGQTKAGKPFSFDGYTLTSSSDKDLSITLRNFQSHTSDEITGVFTILDAICTYETEIYRHQEFVESYKFESPRDSAMKKQNPLKYWF